MSGVHGSAFVLKIALIPRITVGKETPTRASTFATNRSAWRPIGTGWLKNVIENNGTAAASPGIRLRGETDGLVFEKNTIRDTRDRGSRTQTVGILIEPQAGELTLRDNAIETDAPIEDQRPDAARPQPK